MSLKHRLGFAAIACLFAAPLPAGAALIMHKDLSLDIAKTIAEGAIAACNAKGYATSAVVVDRDGETVVAMRADNASPHTMENSMRKAYTARTFRVPSGEIVKRLKENPQFAGVFLTNVIATQGALPIAIGDDVIGAVGVSGAPGGDKDEACAKTGIDKVADELK